MTPATDTQVWQYAVVAMAVAASAIAFACHLSPAPVSYTHLRAHET